MNLKTIKKFLSQVRFGYLLFTSLLIIGILFGLFEIIELTAFSQYSAGQLQWLYISRGVLASLLLMIWAAWTVHQVREVYEERLEQTQVRYRDIIESSADAIITIDDSGIIISWNRGAEHIFGYTREEILGRPIEVIVPDDLIKQQELQCLDYGIKERGYNSHYETERLTKGGDRVLVNLTETAIKDETGDIIGRSQILRDLTDIKLQEEQIQRSERLATIGHMAAGVAHEVGNPLASISSLVQLVQRKSDDEFVQQQLKKVRDHIQRITKIVRDLVDFSRPAGADASPTQVNDIIESAIGLLKHDARCRDVAFELDLQSSLPKIYCIPDKIHQVLVNMLLNAVDAMNGISEPRVVICTGRQNGSIYIRIEDNGKGIPEDERDKIFQPFYTTKEVGEGTGLGLSVSHGIISKLGGSINLDSEVGQGSTFTINLPIHNNGSTDEG